MNLKNILPLKAGADADMYLTAEYRRVIDVKSKIKNEDGTETEEITRAVRLITEGTGKTLVTLVPMKSLSLEDFSFPFRNTTKIRDALRLKVMPYTAGGEVEIFPVTVSNVGKNTEGLAWYVSPEELEVPSPNTGKIWPAPLPFVSGLSENDGNGVTMWVDEENVCSILWQSNKPVMYRWRKLTNSQTPSNELKWYDGYCASQELERGGNFTVNATGNDLADEGFSEIISESVKTCAWLSEVNLSRSALEGARDLERTVNILTRASCWLLAAGVLMLGAEVVRYNLLGKELSEVRSRSENYYRTTFDPQHTGRISNPVTLARDRIASLTGKGEEGHPLDEVLADLGEVFKDFKDTGTTIDIIRYNLEGIDCTGSAPDMTTVLNFRKSWESKANLVQVDNTQLVSGIGYRFDIRVRW